MRGTYPILTTSAFILHTRAIGEADRTITALTKNNGILYIRAKSIRKEGAKMRGMVRPYSCVSLSVVRGKNSILKNISVTDSNRTIWRDRKKYTALVRIFQCFRIYLPIAEASGSEPYAIAETAIHLLKETDSEQAEDIALIAQVLLFTELGYVRDGTITCSAFKSILAGFPESPATRETYRRHLKNALLHQ